MKIHKLILLTFLINITIQNIESNCWDYEKFEKYIPIPDCIGTNCIEKNFYFPLQRVPLMNTIVNTLKKRLTILELTNYIENMGIYLVPEIKADLENFIGKNIEGKNLDNSFVPEFLVKDDFLKIVYKSEVMVGNNEEYPVRIELFTVDFGKRNEIDFLVNRVEFSKKFHFEDKINSTSVIRPYYYYDCTYRKIKPEKKFFFQVFIIEEYFEENLKEKMDRELEEDQNLDIQIKELQEKVQNAKEKIALSEKTKLKSELFKNFTNLTKIKTYYTLFRSLQNLHKTGHALFSITPKTIKSKKKIPIPQTQNFPQTLFLTDYTNTSKTHNNRKQVLTTCPISKNNNRFTSLEKSYNKKYKHPSYINNEEDKTCNRLRDVWSLTLAIVEIHYSEAVTDLDENCYVLFSEDCFDVLIKRVYKAYSGIPLGEGLGFGRIAQFFAYRKMVFSMNAVDKHSLGFESVLLSGLRYEINYVLEAGVMVEKIWNVVQGLIGKIRRILRVI